MYIAIVQVPGAKRSEEDAIKAGKTAAPIFAGKDGLLRKYFLNGETGGGGVYIWESKEKADAWYNDDWWPMMEGRFGVRPVLTFYDNHVVLDNLADELRIDGVPA